MDVEELNLYSEDIPEVDFDVFNERAQVKAGQEYESLPEEKREKIDRINRLCQQFKSADKYVIAAPMWSLMFPGRLKNYIDCIVQDGQTIKLDESSVKGLLDDKDRRLVYIQSSSGEYSGLISSRFDYGTDYMCTLFKSLGVRRVFNLPVEGTGLNDNDISDAVMRASMEADTMVPMFMS